MTGPPPTKPRPRWLHWLAWLGSIVSLLLLVVAAFGRPSREAEAALGWTDLVLCAAFAVEIFTRTGWRQSAWRYLAWRWFDVIALVPLAFFLPQPLWNETLWIWIVLGARVIRAVDRTLGDGFVQRNALALLSGIEEEISDRVLLKIISRIENEVAQAKFGEGAAKALARNKQAILSRIYKEQLSEGAFSKIAEFTGVREAIERAEANMFDSIEAVVASKETDEAIRDLIQTSLRRARLQIAEKSWKRDLGIRRREPSA